MTIKEINKGLEIKKITGLKFGNSRAYAMGEKNEYALFHKDLGYLSFKSDNERRKVGVKFPYTPLGRRKALQSILDGGGFTDFEGVEWIWPIQEETKGTATLPR